VPSTELAGLVDTEAFQPNGTHFSSFSEQKGGRFGGPPVVLCVSVGWLGDDDGHAGVKLWG
jgi:hypothetical protein